jgi:hypothetical protein
LESDSKAFVFLFVETRDDVIVVHLPFPLAARLNSDTPLFFWFGISHAFLDFPSIVANDHAVDNEDAGQAPHLVTRIPPRSRR